MGKSQNKQIIIRAIITCLLLTPILLNEIDNRNKQVLYAAMVYTPIYFLLLFFLLSSPFMIFELFLKQKFDNYEFANLLIFEDLIIQQNLGLKGF